VRGGHGGACAALWFGGGGGRFRCAHLAVGGWRPPALLDRRRRAGGAHTPPPWGLPQPHPFEQALRPRSGGRGGPGAGGDAAPQGDQVHRLACGAPAGREGGTRQRSPGHTGRRRRPPSRAAADLWRCPGPTAAPRWHASPPRAGAHRPPGRAGGRAAHLSAAFRQTGAGGCRCPGRPCRGPLRPRLAPGCTAHASASACGAAVSGCGGGGARGRARLATLGGRRDYARCNSLPTTKGWSSHLAQSSAWGAGAAGSGCGSGWATTGFTIASVGTSTG
jgi:hypothetical protein